MGPDPSNALDTGDLPAEVTADVEPGPTIVRGTLAEKFGQVPCVLASETDPGETSSPAVEPSSAKIPNGSSRYQLLGEIGRGGMGAILRGRDPDLGRDLAIKVLLDKHRNQPEMARRFVEEAQIGGQLQHPGIVPVYELGAFADRRPYFTMKLVQGHTFADLLRPRRDSAEDLTRFLGIFEQVCQTMAYAHARGVIHRDLKPGNIMVGAFGEVQVMDWGLAKVLHREVAGVVQKAQLGPEAEVVRTARSGSDADASRAGCVMGTLAYMAPEQARGDVDLVDERADVFGLGAILCEILTGKPPFLGSAIAEIHDKAERGDIAEVLGRLDACRADAELVDLARRCVAPRREDRLRDARVVAAAVTSYQRAVQERLRAVELARVEAQARADEAVQRRALSDQLALEAQARADAERKRRRATVMLAASVIGTMALVGVGARWSAQQRDARRTATAHAVHTAMADARRLQGAARMATPGDVSKASDALAKADQAEGVLAAGEADQDLRDQVTALKVELAAELAGARDKARQLENDRILTARLEAVRTERGEHLDWRRTDAEYAAVFREFGLDLEQQAPQQAGGWIARRSEPVALTSFLDDWALARRQARGEQDKASWEPILAAAREADPDAWRDALRGQVSRNDRQAIKQLADDRQQLELQKAPSLLLLASALKDAGDLIRAERVLRRACQLHPGDFWFNFELGRLFMHDSSFPRSDEAVHFAASAASLRPRSAAAHVNLGVALGVKALYDDAIAEFRAALRLNPDIVQAHANLGLALLKKGLPREAIPELRAAVRLQPVAGWYGWLGQALSNTGQPEEALLSYEKERDLCQRSVDANPNNMTELLPGLAESYGRIGNQLVDMGRLPEALAAHEKALALQQPLVGPGLGTAALRWELAHTHQNIGLVLSRMSRPVEALASYEKARAVAQALAEADPGSVDLQNELVFTLSKIGNLRRDQAQLAEAARTYRQAAAILEQIRAPDAATYYNLGCFHALLAGVAARPGSGLSAADGQAELDIAMSWLRKFIADGPHDPAGLRTDPDLEALHARPDFQLLLMDSAFPLKPFAR